MSKKRHVPLWLILLISTVLVMSLMYYVRQQKTTVVAKKEKKAIEKKIDSIEAIVTYDFNDLSEKSKNRSKLSTKIKKSNEKIAITVRDTTYDAMCKYITDFKPE